MLFGILLFILGLIFGSFITAFTWRYPRGISIAKGRSMCPDCRHKISWYDNIPLFSFIILGGKCRNCKKPISWRYPAIEFSTGICFVIIFLKGLSLYQGQSLYAIALNIFLFLILEAIFIIDLENQIIPDSLVFSGIFVFLTYSIIFNQQFIFASIFSGFVSATFLLIIHLVTRGRGMGLGDVKFAILGGMMAGPVLSIPWLFIAFLTGGVTGIILILTGKARLKSKIAFGPFLVLALLIVIIWSNQIGSLVGLLL